MGTPATDLGIAYETYEMDRDQVLTEAGLDTLMPEPDEDVGVVYGPARGSSPASMTSTTRATRQKWDFTPPKPE